MPDNAGAGEAAFNGCPEVVCPALLTMSHSQPFCSCHLRFPLVPALCLRQLVSLLTAAAVFPTAIASLCLSQDHFLSREKGSFNYAMAATPVMPECFKRRLLTQSVVLATDRLPGLQQGMHTSQDIA